MGGMKVGERANAELTGDTLEEARSLLELLRAERVIDTQTYRRRLDQISCAVVRRGHYRMVRPKAALGAAEVVGPTDCAVVTQLQMSR